MLFDKYDSIRVINLAHRTDRRAEMLAELRRVNLGSDPRVSFFDARTFPEAGTFSSKGARGVFHSHLAILEEAARDGRSVLIFEDDLDFAPDIASYALPDTPPIFYGAYYAKTPGDLPNSDIVGAHFMGFDAPTAGRIAAFLQTILASGHHPPIDGAYVWFRRAHPDVRTVFAPQPLGRQRLSRTDIAPLRFYDRVPGLRHAASYARKVRRDKGQSDEGTVATAIAIAAAAVLGLLAGTRATSKDHRP